MKSKISHIDLAQFSKFINFNEGTVAEYRYIKIYDSVGEFYAATLYATYNKDVIFDHIEAWNNHVKDSVTATLGVERVTLTNSKFVDNSSEVDYGSAYFS